MRYRHFLLFAALLCALSCATSVAAQSGRKQKRAEPTPPVQGVNQPETRTTQSETVAVDESGPNKDKDNGKPKTSVIVMSNLTEIGIPMFYSDTARAACAQEIQKNASSTRASDGGSNKNRSDAMKVAKENEDTYVVLLELVFDQFSNTANGLDLRFSVFEPKTGKQIAFGSGMPVPPNGTPTPPMGMNREQVYLEWMARDAAQRIISKLKLRPSY